MRRLKLFILFGFIFLFASITSEASTFTVNDVPSLINAITVANSNGEDDVITLTANITLTAFDNTTNGANALPVIQADGGQRLVIDGAGFSLDISGATCGDTPTANDFRLLTINVGASLYLDNISSVGGCANRGSSSTAGDDGSVIYNSGTLIIINSNLRGIWAKDQGGTIYNSGDLTLINTAITGVSEFRGGGIYNDGTAMIIDSQIGGQAYNRGGGIYNNGTATITNSSLTGGIGAPASSPVIRDGGGAIYNAGILTITTSRFQSTSTGSGGGSSVKNTGNLTIQNTYITSSATDAGAIFNSGTATIINSSFFATALNFGGQGGAIYNDGITNLDNVTIYDNGNFSETGGGIYMNSGTLTTRNSIITFNNDMNGLDCVISSGTFNANANNVIGESGDNSGCPTGLNDIIPPVGVFASDIVEPFPANNGGPTQTIALLPSGIAVDASGASATAFDQRGVPANGVRDVGAFESGTTPTYPTVSFASSDVTVNENAGTITMPLTISGASNFIGTAQVFILNTHRGTATSDSDYTVSDIRTVNINCATGCPSSLTIPVTINTDTITEPDETILFEIVATNDFAQIGGLDEYTVTIQDSDAVAAPPVVAQPVNNPEPAIDVFDPAISKLGFLVPGQTGVTDEELEWVVTVSNVGTVAGVNLIITAN